MWKIRMWKKNREMIHFSGRRHTRLGVTSAVIGIVNVLGFTTVSILSGTSHGNGGIYLGIIGLLLFGFAIFGFYLSYKALKEKDVFYRFPMIGISLNGLMIIIFLILYIIGFGG